MLRHWTFRACGSWPHAICLTNPPQLLSHSKDVLAEAFAHEEVDEWVVRCGSLAEQTGNVPKFWKTTRNVIAKQCKIILGPHLHFARPFVRGRVISHISVKSVGIFFCAKFLWPQHFKKYFDITGVHCTYLKEFPVGDRMFPKCST